MSFCFLHDGGYTKRMPDYHYNGPKRLKCTTGLDCTDYKSRKQVANKRKDPTKMEGSFFKLKKSVELVFFDFPVKRGKTDP